MLSDNITLIFFKRDLEKNKVIEITIKLMSLMNESFLPIPSKIDQADKKEMKISSYLDKQIMSVVEEELLNRELPFVLRGVNEDFSISISPSTSEYGISIEFPANIEPLPSAEQIKKLFLSICILINPDIGRCYARRAFSRFKNKYFEWEGRTPNFGFFTWLQYFGKREFHLQGGDAILQIPIIKSERIEEGVVIEVGDGPLDACTPEGEELLLKSTLALPPVIK